MRDYCHNELKKGKYRFPCPDLQCQKTWGYFLVRHVAGFDDETRSTVEKELTENNIRQGLGCQQCPGCETWCSPMNPGRIRLKCDVCSRGGRPFEFCWGCQREWKSKRGYRCCGNEGCDGKDPRIRILTVAEKMVINDIPGCPSIRACPKCGLLINLTSGCRHMTCGNCNAQFCFICLTRWTGVTHLTRKCTVAPVQVQIPDLSWESRNDNASSPPAADNSGCTIL